MMAARIGPTIGLLISLSAAFVSFAQLLKDHSGADTDLWYWGLGSAAGGVLIALQRTFHDAFAHAARAVGMGTMPLEITAGIIALALVLFFGVRLKKS